MLRVMIRLTIFSVVLAVTLPLHLAAADVPDFWKSRLSDVIEVLNSAQKGQVILLGESWGHRPIFSISYGERDPYTSTTHFSAAAYARNPAAFCKREPGAKPVLFILGPVHGGEMEGVVGCLNLVKLLETGTDFRGLAWPGITDNADKLRIVIIPLANPDGRERLDFDSYMGKTDKEMTRYSQGTHKDGSLWGWPTVTMNQPMVGDVGILGAYFNDGGINIYTDNFFNPQAQETKLIFDLAVKEVPDFIVNVHSHEMPAELLKTYLVPSRLTERTGEIQQLYAAHLEKRGLPLTPPRETASGAFELSDALYHATGAISMVFEGPEGIVGEADKPITFDQILDSHLALYEFLIELGVSRGGYMGREGAVRGDWLPTPSD